MITIMLFYAIFILNLRGVMNFFKIFENTGLELENEYIIRPLEHKGLNKHFINLVCADVFKPKKQSFFGFIKDLFSYGK